MNPPPIPASGAFPAWRERLLALCDDLRVATRRALTHALERGAPELVNRPEERGAGDWAFGLDLPGEARIAAWAREQAATAPLSVLTEHHGWMHLGPDPARGSAGVRELPGFDHGGPRIAFDPVDGTRNLMADLRSAWTVVSFAPPGAGAPRLADVSAGIVAELPDSRAAARRTLVAERGGACRLALHGLADGALLSDAPLAVDADDRPDHGYFPFFRYLADLRPATAELEAAFFARLAEHEGADVRSCYDDQYITSAGQLVLLALGTYRMVVDPRALLAERRGRPTVTTKPYDVAGALVCAEAAGCALAAPDGTPLDFPIDTETPVSWIGWTNAATRRRLEPHWRAAAGFAPA